jgi:hypothetical protein
MTTAFIVQYTDPKSEAASYVNGGRIGSQPGLGELHDLLDYLQDTYDEDDALRILEWRAITASQPPKNVEAADEGILRAERTRVEKWALYLEGKDDPEAYSIRQVWKALDACFNPHTDELEGWFYGEEAQIVEELSNRYGFAPSGDAPAMCT